VDVGILALQGAFAAHEKVLSDLGASVTRVKTPAELSTVDAVVLPGGESTTMSMLLDSSGLREPLEVLLRHGFPVFGTCAASCQKSPRIGLSACQVSQPRAPRVRQAESFRRNSQRAGCDSRQFSESIAGAIETGSVSGYSGFSVKSHSPKVPRTSFRFGGFFTFP